MIADAPTMKPPSLTFDTKLIQLHGKTYPILLQNENGPCALIAICNLLILNNSKHSKQLYRLLKDVKRIPLDDIIQCLANLIINNVVNTVKIDSENDGMELDIDKCLLLLPNLHKGLVVNPNFNGSFKHNDGDGIIFKFLELLNIKLLHGWIIDDTRLSKFSYDDVQESMITRDQLLDENGLVQLQHFISDFPTQLSPTGLKFLNDNCLDNQFAILFRNDHFATLYKHDNILYTLVTDLGYKKHKGIVWETLLTVNGSVDSFYDSNFHKTFKDDEFDDQDQLDILNRLNSIENDIDLDNDSVIARNLQEFEDQKLASHLNETFTLTTTKNSTQQTKIKRKKPIKRSDVKQEHKTCILV